jgi:hypothetical protein
MKRFIAFIISLVFFVTPLTVFAEESPTTQNNGGGYDGCSTSNIALAARGCRAFVNGQWVTSNGDGTVTTAAGNVLDGSGRIVASVSGDGAKVASAAEFRFDHDFSAFVSVLVDDVWVDPSQYSARSGSTIITLSQAFINTLSVGTHKLTVTFSDAAPMSATFTVSQASRRSGAVPNTSDPDNSAYIVMLVGAIFVMAGAGYILFVNKH